MSYLNINLIFKTIIEKYYGYCDDENYYKSIIDMLEKIYEIKIDKNFINLEDLKNKCDKIMNRCFKEYEFKFNYTYKNIKYLLLNCINENMRVEFPYNSYELLTREIIIILDKCCIENKIINHQLVKKLINNELNLWYKQEDNITEFYDKMFIIINDEF